jgi:hypothetical protein
MRIDPDAALEMEDPLRQDRLLLTPSLAWRLTPVVEDSIEDVAEDEVTGPKEDVEEGITWTTGVIATHVVGLRKVAGEGIVTTGTGWIEWIVMLTQIPDVKFNTNAIPETANYSETNWKLAPTLATTQDSLARRCHHHLSRHLHLLLDPFLTGD